MDRPPEARFPQRNRFRAAAFGTQLAPKSRLILSFESTWTTAPTDGIVTTVSLRNWRSVGMNLRGDSDHTGGCAMRTVAACLSLSLWLSLAGNLPAQSKDGSVGPPNTVESARTRELYTRQLVHQRAIARARQRVNRIEAREWAGHSPLRPNYGPSSFVFDPYAAMWSPYVGYYTPNSYYHHLLWR
jgi:hypothetical protein